jgi:hypothetical protein
MLIIIIWRKVDGTENQVKWNKLDLEWQIDLKDKSWKQRENIRRSQGQWEDIGGQERMIVEWIWSEYTVCMYENI